MTLIHALKKAFLRRWGSFGSIGSLYLSLALVLWVPISLNYYEALEHPLSPAELITISGEFHQINRPGAYHHVYRIKTNNGSWHTFECGYGRRAGCPPPAIPIPKGTQVTAVYHPSNTTLLLELATKEGTALELSKMASKYGLNPTTKPYMFISGLFFVLFLLTPILHKEHNIQHNN